MQEYLALLRDVELNGNHRPDRTGVGTKSVFGRQIRLDLRSSFPLLTTKRVHFKSVAAELLWMLSGSTNIETLRQQGVTIWDEWADKNGDLGPIYGEQMRRFPGIGRDGPFLYDQISAMLEGIRENPFSRRHLVSVWNPTALPIDGLSPQANVAIGKMAIAPCHFAFQCYVQQASLNDHTKWYKALSPSESLTMKDRPTMKLSLQLYQRSADLFLGVPFNIAGYGLLLRMLAHYLKMIPGDLIVSFGDLHLYSNHCTDDIVYEQLSRQPKALPKLEIVHRPETFFDYRLEHFNLIGYDPHPAIKAEVAV